MRKICLSLLIIGAFASVLKAWPRLGSGANIVTQNAGDKGIPFSVVVGTSPAVKVYTADPRDREILFENTDGTYYLHCSTHSAIAATSGIARFAIPPKPLGLTTNATYSSGIWCVAEPAAGSTTIELIGVIERDSKD